MARITEADVRRALAAVPAPGRNGNVVACGMISGVAVRGGNVGFAIEIRPDEREALEATRRACEDAVRALPGVTSATAVLTAERGPAGAADGGERPPGAGVGGVNAIVAVASGKGGVGKSTVAVNLALAMTGLGKRVGMLDADIYGPSQPRLLGLSGKPDSPDGKTIEPLRGYGVPCMSMGFLVDEETPMVWRGPMVQSALRQMLDDVLWGDLDVLIVDMPPGTGDAQLTLAQRVPLAGAVIVSTPQDLALIDARRGLAMFRKVEVPVLGIVENMSFYSCPNCGAEAHIFGHGGARDAAAAAGVACLGEVPLDAAVRETSDAGRPIVAETPDGAQARAFSAIAARVLEALERGDGKPPPRIVVDRERAPRGVRRE